MILSELKHYLVERPAASLADIATRFDVAPEVARSMLEVLIAKGRVERMGGARCGECTVCAPGVTELYRWRDASRS
jgi:predicted ArsR family transcriptional regulator